MKVVDKSGVTHIVRKYVIDDNGVESVWCNTWYGRHVIGQDCKLFNWKPILEYKHTSCDVILKTGCGRVFRGYIDEHGQTWEFDGFEVGKGRGSSYILVKAEPVEWFTDLN